MYKDDHSDNQVRGLILARKAVRGYKLRSTVLINVNNVNVKVYQQEYRPCVNIVRGYNTDASFKFDIRFNA